ncbi:MAG: hypothetical protein FJX76_03610 [Armatimonadetes bacterium]|nr:hypothetical protein [Armatimonadota bacterium]
MRFAFTIFLAAFLLFEVELILGKAVLPWYGASPSVWTTCMLFFQMTLLLGYLYAHLLVSRLSGRAQATVHVALLVASLALLLGVGLLPGNAWKPLTTDHPVRDILILLSVFIGLPFLLLSASGPLLGAWYARISQRSPYRLYAVSNAGSLLALLAYPLAVEPLVALPGQAAAWTLAYAVYCVASAACAKDAAPAPAAPAGPEPFRALWVILPATASLLLLASTNQISQEVAVSPLLWTMPLALYLLSLILTFESDRIYRRSIFIPLFLGCAAGTVWTLSPQALYHVIPAVSLQLLTLFVACMVCHGEVARLKPGISGLTGFYLAVAGGGALGGLLVTVVAPQVFDGFWELQIGLWTCAALAARQTLLDFPVSRRPAAVVAALILVAYGAALWPSLRRFSGPHVLHASRNFYGVVRVVDQGPTLVLASGSTIHGWQSKENPAQVLGYFAPESGVGRLFASLPAQRPRRVAVVGLGAGVLCAYGRKGDHFTCYEINPTVIALAAGPAAPFRFVANSPAQVEVVAGDARLSLERETDAPPYDLIVLDAFSGDAIPIHLMTREALDLYLRRLAPTGIIAANVTNRFVDLGPVLARLAAERGLTVRRVDVDVPKRSRWLFLARDPAALDMPGLGAGPGPDPSAAPLWTDAYGNVLQALEK